MTIRPCIGVLAVEQHGHRLVTARRTPPKFVGCLLIAVVDNGLRMTTTNVSTRYAYSKAWSQLQSGTFVSLELYTLNESLLERCTVEETTVLSRHLAKAS